MRGFKSIQNTMARYLIYLIITMNKRFSYKQQQRSSKKSNSQLTISQLIDLAYLLPHIALTISIAIAMINRFRSDFSISSSTQQMYIYIFIRGNKFLINHG